MPDHDDIEVFSVGILPIISSENVIPPNPHFQALHLIANIFKFLTSNSSYVIKSIILYVSNYKFAAVVLRYFQNSGLGEYIIQCAVKQMRFDILTTADLQLYTLEMLKAKF